MKKFIFSALCVIVYFVCAFFPIAHRPARADDTATGTYACILEENTFFYAAKDEKQGLFLLPKTYFVKVLDRAPDYTKIEYLTDNATTKKLLGYAKTSKLTFVDYVPQTPYLYLSFKVTYKLSDELFDPSFLNELIVECTYYGDYTIGSKTYCYVLRGEEFGYVLKPDDLSITENPEYAERLQSLSPAPEPDDEPLDDKSDTASPAQIAILIALCLLVPVLAALILKSPRKPPYEDEP